MGPSTKGDLQMSFTASQDTLRYHASRPLAVERDMRDVPLRDFVKNARHDFESGLAADPMAPEEAGLIFYALQHAVSEIRDRYGLDTPLPEDARAVVDAYHRECNPIAIRLAYYVWAISITEARHKHWSGDKREKFEKGLTSDMGYDRGQVVAGYFYKVCSNGRKWVLQNPHADITMGEFNRALTRVFMGGGWSSAYGGPKWKVIAKTFEDFTAGALSAQLFIDRAMNLAHNTAPIFNKGYLFKSQSSSIKYILDVQHSSQVPNLLLNPGKFAKEITPRVMEIHQLIQAACSDAFCEPVDWFKVAATSKGGVSYGALKSEQTAAGQTSKHAMEMEQAAIKKAIEKAKNSYIVDHKLTLAKLTREQI
jgi:hypothetical protein